MAQKRIVIIGGGFAGVYTARALERALGASEAEICLVNREDYFVFQPLLPEILSGSIELLDVVSPVRSLCPRTRLYVRDVERIDLTRRVVTLTPRVRPRSTELPFDYLVLAPGTVTDFSGMPGLADHAFAFRTLGDALRLRNQVLQALEEAANEHDAEFRRALLTFVVGGGGFSGVEVIAELNDFLRREAKSYGVRPEEIRCVLVHSGDRILPEVAPRLAQYAQDLLLKRGVEVKLKAKVRAATAGTVLLSTDETIPSRTLVSTVPAAAVPVIQALDCRKERGRLVVNKFLELAGNEGRVWAAGDCSVVRLADGTVAPSTAQHAIREARTVAANIRAAMRAGAKQPFCFPGLGKLGSLGRHSAVAEVLGVRISGFPAWFLWRTVYLMKMPGVSRKVRVGFDWLTALLLPSDVVQLHIRTSYNIANEHFEAGEVVFEQGDVGDRLYVVHRGEVEVLINGARVALLGEGQYFGEISVLGGLRRTATVRATRATDLLAVPKGDFERLAEHFPALDTEIRDLANRRSASGQP